MSDAIQLQIIYVVLAQASLLLTLNFDERMDGGTGSTRIKAGARV